MINESLLVLHCPEIGMWEITKAFVQVGQRLLTLPCGVILFDGWAHIGEEACVGCDGIIAQLCLDSV